MSPKTLLMLYAIYDTDSPVPVTRHYPDSNELNT